MLLLSGFVVLALVASSEGSVGPSTNSSFCTESKECLEYELVCRTDEYEVRHYSPTRWVSTDAEAYFMGVGAAMAFRRLFQYITGANEAGVQMDMTAPVLVRIPEETKMWEPAIYTLNFPLPAAYQDEPPTPTNDKLYFTDMSEMDVYVRSYGGWMLSVTSRLHAHLLTKELERVGASYNHSYHYGVGYDSPLKLLNRHNEVWYVSQGKVVCTDPQEPTPAHTPRPTPTGLSMDSERLQDMPSDLSSLQDMPSDLSSLQDTPSDSPSFQHMLSDLPSLPNTPSDLSSFQYTPSNSPSLQDMPSDLSSLQDTPSDSPSLPDTPSDLSSFQDTPSDLSSLQDTPSDLSSLQDTPSDLSSLQDTPSDLSFLQDTPSDLSSFQDLPSDLSFLQDTPSDLSSLQDAPSDLSSLQDAPSDLPLLTPSNMSSNATLNVSSPLPSGTPSVPVSLPSDLPAEVTFSQPLPSVLSSLDPSSNSSDPIPASPSLELQADAGVWNSTAHGSVDTQAEHNVEADSDNAHH